MVDSPPDEPGDATVLARIDRLAHSFQAMSGQGIEVIDFERLNGPEGLLQLAEEWRFHRELDGEDSARATALEGS